MTNIRTCKTLKFPGSEVIYKITDDTKVPIQQGAENAGKVLGVDSNGLVTLMNVDGAGTGGSGTSSIIVDSALYTTSTNPVQNKVITSAINNINNTLNNKVGLDEVNAAIQAAIGDAIGGSY